MRVLNGHSSADPPLQIQLGIILSCTSIGILGQVDLRRLKAEGSGNSLFGHI